LSRDEFDFLIQCVKESGSEHTFDFDFEERYNSVLTKLMSFRLGMSREDCLSLLNKSDESIVLDFGEGTRTTSDSPTVLSRKELAA